MKFLVILSLSFLFFYPSVIVQAQSHDDSIDYSKLYKYVMDEYGFDQVLVNGIFYEDKYWKKDGHQFFPEDQLYKGTLMFRGKEYKGIEMKYDICDQQLILYISFNNLTVRVVPSNDFISAFSLGDRYFSKYNFEGEPRFYQVVFDTDKLKCLYYWFKQVRETDDGGNSSYYYYEFTDSEKKNYLKINGTFEMYRNNRSFTELFPQEIRDMVKKYMKANRIKVVKSTDERMAELLTYCNSLL
jgi:hypothetical protein